MPPRRRSPSVGDSSASVPAASGSVSAARTASVARRGRRAGAAGALTPADLVVLSLLAERTMHGYELLKEYERQEVADWAPVSRPHVYYALGKLAERGLVAAARRAPGPRRESAQPWRVTPSGRAALAAALDEVSWAARNEAPPFLTWMGLAIHAKPEARQRVVEARREAVAARLAREQATLAGIRADRGARVGVAEWMVGLTVAQCELELSWLAALERDGVLD